MDELIRIDEEVFFEMLKRMFFLPLKGSERTPLIATFRYWEKSHSKEDERKLALAMAKLHHHRKKEGKKHEPLDDARFKELFDQSEGYEDVKEIESIKGLDAEENLANMFFTVLTRIKPMPLGRVLADELKFTRGTEISPDNLDAVFNTFHDEKLTALCFSGGGIRSATFGLGIVQALAKSKLLTRFDYLSTVSGGGYLGSWLSAWVLREKLTELAGGKKAGSEAGEIGVDVIEEKSQEFDISDEERRDPHRRLGIANVQEKINGQPVNGTGPNPEPTQLQHLREYSNYMSPRVGLLSADTWTLVAIYLRNLFLNLTIFIPLIAAILMLPRFLFMWTRYDEPDSWVIWVVLIGSMVSACLAMAFVISRLPSKNIRQIHHLPPPAPQPIQKKTADPGEGEQKEAAATDKKDDAKKETRERSDSVPDLDADTNTDVGVLVRGVFPLLIAAIGAAYLWAWNRQSGGRLYEMFDLFGFGVKGNPNLAVAYFLIGAIAAFAFTAGVLLWRGKSLSFLAALVTSILGAILAWLVGVKIIHATSLANGMNMDAFEWQIFFCLAVPTFLLIILITATVFVGLSSGTMTDEDREWLARYGGWVLIVGAVWILLNAIVLLGPSLLASIFRVDFSAWTAAILPVLVSLAGVVSAVVSLLGGFSEKAQVRNEPIKSRTSRFLAFAPRIASVVFLGFIFIGLASLTSFIAWAIESFFNANGATLSHVYVLKHAPLIYLGAIFIGLAAIGVVMACFVNVNKFSLHGAYRDRLVRAYLGASNTRRKKNLFTGFDDSDNFQLHRLKDQKPFHVINATVNLIAGKTLAWQDRKAASFTMSPLHCGSWILGYRNTNEYCRNDKLGPCKNLNNCNLVGKECESVEKCQLPGKAIRLGTAMAISGAAANPNMGYYSSSVVTFLMSLFNIRLGWWLGNTNRVGAKLDYKGRPFYSKPSPTVAVLPLMNETFGRTDEFKRYINVTDGGHFENLALYEMILRRCRLIFLSDGAADASFKFGEIANAIQKCKVDLGVDIQFLGSMNIYPRTCSDEMKAKGSRFAIAQITYPEKLKGKKRVGFLLYMRPAYYGTNEPRDVRYYAESNDSFPHQSTGDQMYDEKQFEAYRGLGFLTMDEVVRLGKQPVRSLDDVIKDELVALAKAHLLEGRRELADAVGDFYEMNVLEEWRADLIARAKAEFRNGKKPGALFIARLFDIRLEADPDEMSEERKAAAEKNGEEGEPV